MTSSSAHLDILYEDDDLLVVNKPPGISVHPSIKESHGTLVERILAHDATIRNVGENPQRPGIVHRLDKDTSGVLVVAKTQEIFDELKGLFQSRLTEKRYLAIVDGIVKQPRGTIDFPIGRMGMRRVVDREEALRPASPRFQRGERAQGKTLTKVRDAKTEFIVRKRFKDATLLEVRPTTGRMHQIRVHLKAIEHPILGDRLYGGKAVAARATRQMLHALSLAFSLRDGRRFAFEADPPGDFQEILEALAEKPENDTIVEV